MAHSDHPQTVGSICKFCGVDVSDEDQKTLLEAGEKNINLWLDSSIGYLFADYVFKDPKASAFSKWREFMQQGQPKPPEGPIDMETYQKAMFIKALTCSPHAPIGLLRRNVFRNSKLLDVGGGLGFWSAMYRAFGAKVTLCEKPEVVGLLGPEFKKGVRVLAEPFPLADQDGSWHAISLFEVLHGRSRETIQKWFDEDLPRLLCREGLVVVTDVNPAGATLYSRLFDARIKQMTNGVGSAISAHEVFALSNKRFTLTAMVSWHSLPYYTVLLRRIN